MSNKTISLISAILNINGVQTISINRYVITVEKGKAFDWDADNIQNEILIVLEKFQGCD